MQQKQQDLPIGYWIKKVDQLLTQSIDQIHQTANLTRVGWQLLHTIHERGAMPAKELMGIVRPFASETEAKTILGSLAKENLLYWEENTGSLVSLTAQGKQFYQDCWEKQKLIRQKAMEGIGETDYQIAVQTLQKMASNLENP